MAPPFILHWDLSSAGMFAGIAGADVQLDHWPRLALVNGAGKPVRLAPLLALLERGLGEVKEGRIFVPHGAIAGLSSVDADGMGLPPTMPFRLVVPRGKAGIASPQFRLAYHLLNDGQRAERVENRFGAVIAIRGERYRVPSPLFEIMEGIDAFNAFPPNDTTQKIEAWARIREFLPDEAILDPHLRTIRVRHPTSVRLRTRERPDGSIDFDPELRTRSAPEHPEDDGESVQALDSTHQQTFEQMFRRFPSARSAYTTGQNTYVLVDEPLVKVLDVARTFQREPDPQKRRAFAENPTVFLREALSDTLGEDALLALFEDENLSDRVVGLTRWQAAEAARSAGDRAWVPSGADPTIDLATADLSGLGEPELRQLKARLEHALAAGERDVALDAGGVLLAQPSVLRAVERALAESGPESPADAAEVEPLGGGDETGAQLVLGIADNVEELGYSAPVASRGGSTGAPAGLQGQLFEHQHRALSWLQSHWLAGHAGCLLADDMGLGKTLEALAFIAWLHEQMRAGAVARQPTLIVAPSGLLKNWIDEHARHLKYPGLGTPLQAFGAELQGLRERAGREMESGRPCLDVAAMCQADWVMTTYETLRDYQHSFARVPWGAAVFDEVQKIKNPTTRMTWAAKAMNRSFSIALTGTPVENSLTDLWSIVDAVAPGTLESLTEFKEKYGDREASDDGERLKQILMGDPQPSLMLRRLKQDHLKGLPERHVHEIREEMPTSQARAYEAAVAVSRREGSDGHAMLRTLQELRRIALCPRIRDQSGDEGFINSSARLKACFSILDQISARGEKALIFVEYLEMQATLAELITRRYALDSVPLIINGTMTGVARKLKVDRFQHRSGFDVMLLSPKAGGVGLTLTAANHVIHLTRWWNPAVEDQCTDRVYRIGQSQPVHVYLPMAVHPEYGEASFDIVLNSLLEDKRKLSRSIVPAASEPQNTRALWQGTVGSVAAPAPTSTDADLTRLSPELRQVLSALKSDGLPMPVKYDGLESSVGALLCESIAAWPGHRLAIVGELRPEAVRLWERHGWTAVSVAEPTVIVRALGERVGRTSSAA